MGYELSSLKFLEAPYSQYRINNEGPVELSLIGRESDCILRPIQDERIKEVLAKVGRDFERNYQSTFFNFDHTFTPIKGSQENEELVKEIFKFVSQAVKDQTQDCCRLSLADMGWLAVQVGEDRSFSPPARAYKLVVKMSEKTIEKLSRLNVIVKTYRADQEESEMGGIGQTSIGF